MLTEIGSVDRIPDFIAKAKDKNDPFRLMGFGHRVYKNYDPRAKIMQKTTHEVLGDLGIKDDPLLDVAMELEKIALTDEYFINKKLYPNIDFYSGITLKALGFPTTMFTVLFAVARTVGWIAQWKEMIEDPSQKIGRRASSTAARPSATTCRSRNAERGGHPYGKCWETSLTRYWTVGFLGAYTTHDCGRTGCFVPLDWERALEAPRLRGKISLRTHFVMRLTIFAVIAMLYGRSCMSTKH